MSDISNMNNMSESPTDRLADQSPSAKLVFLVLDREGSLTQQAISDESLLAVRTVRYALSRLETAGLVEKQSSVMDARQRIYALSKVGEIVAESEDGSKSAVTCTKPN
jgi:DNA-binding MarR family transcriptional regulator